MRGDTSQACLAVTRATTSGSPTQTSLSFRGRAEQDISHTSPTHFPTQLRGVALMGQ